MLQTFNAPEGDYTFYKEDRERIKSRSMLPTETLRYIEALEAIAYAGYETWKHTNHADKPSAKAVSCLHDLYDALAAVNWMDDEKPEAEEENETDVS